MRLKTKRIEAGTPCASCNGSGVRGYTLGGVEKIDGECQSCDGQGTPRCSVSISVRCWMHDGARRRVRCERDAVAEFDGLRFCDEHAVELEAEVDDAPEPWDRDDVSAIPVFRGDGSPTLVLPVITTDEAIAELQRRSA